jgi:multidrug resistance efflux pump
MAELAAADAWSALLETRAARIAAERAWEDIDTDDYQDDIDDANDDVLELEDDLEEAQEDFDRYKDLDKDNTTRKKYEEDLEEIQDDYDEAVRDRDELVLRRDQAEAAVEQTLAAEAQALKDYEATRNGPDPDQLALAQARLASAQTQITATQASLEDLELTAPFDGIIVDTNIVENEMVSPQRWAFLIADYSHLYVQTNDLTELEVVKISVGQMVSLVPDALPDLELSGMVDEISDDYHLQSGDILYDVRILIDEPDPRLRWGMTVEIVFKEE